jgi:hypothetical protein
MGGRRIWLGAAAVFAFLVATPTAMAAVDEPWAGKLDSRHSALMAGGDDSGGVVARNFKVLGHHDLGMADANGDVWAHGRFAYVGTWSDPCNGRGVKIVDVSRLRQPRLIGTLASREGTSAEDMVVRRVSTSFFSGDLIAVGIQRCDPENPALDEQQFGIELWNVSNPYSPVKLGELGITNGDGGVHELDLFQRGRKVYALLAVPFREWFDPMPGGDFVIADVTNPRAPFIVSDWGAGENGFSPGPFWGQGSFGATFDHSARVSKDKKKAYVSYWDLGVLTFDIRDVSNPRLVSRTRYKPRADGDAHSMTPYRNRHGRQFILQNDEDFDPRSPTRIRFPGGRGIGNENPGASPLWLEPGHRVNAPVIRAANQGCLAGDYPADTPGKIAVVTTLFPFFDPEGGEEPACTQDVQEAAAEAAGAAAVVHDFIAEATSPQFFDLSDVGIPAVFTDHETAQEMVEAGRATLRALRPSWGFLRVFDAKTGKQVAKFDGAPNVHAFPPPDGFWSIHNTETRGRRAYSSWYTNGVVALDLRPLDRRPPGNPRMVGQFVPAVPGDMVPEVWGVFVRRDGVIFASDIPSGLWIVRPTGRAASGGHDD